MRVTYKPEDPAVSGDGGSWEFDPGRVLGAHAEMIERRFGKEWDSFAVAVMRGSIKARRVLLWYFRMREHPGYRIEDLPDFYTGELVVSFSVRELREMREAASKADWDNDEERDQAFAVIDAQLAEAAADEEAEKVSQAGGREVDEGEGKAPLPTVETSTGSRQRRSRASSRGSGDG